MGPLWQGFARTSCSLYLLQMKSTAPGTNLMFRGQSNAQELPLGASCRHLDACTRSNGTFAFAALGWMGLRDGIARQQSIPTSMVPSWVQSCEVCLRGAVVARVSCYGNVTEKNRMHIYRGICVFFDKGMSCQLLLRSCMHLWYDAC